MNKLERFYNSLGEPTEANNGDFGYFVTIGDLVKNGGSDEFFRKVRKSDKKVSKSVFYGLTGGTKNVYCIYCDWNSVLPDY